MEIKSKVWGETPLLSVEGLILCSLLELQVIIFLLSFSIERIVTHTWFYPLTFNHILSKCKNSLQVFVVTKIAIMYLPRCVPYGPSTCISKNGLLIYVCVKREMSHLFFSTESKTVSDKASNSNATEQWGKMTTCGYGRVIINLPTICPQLEIELILFTLPKKNWNSKKSRIS